MNRVRQKVEELKQVLKEETGIEKEPNIMINYHLNHSPEKVKMSLTEVNQIISKLKDNCKSETKLNINYSDGKYITAGFENYWYHNNGFELNIFFPFPKLKNKYNKNNIDKKEGELINV